MLLYYLSFASTIFVSRFCSFYELCSSRDIYYRLNNCNLFIFRSLLCIVSYAILFHIVLRILHIKKHCIIHNTMFLNNYQENLFFFFFFTFVLTNLAYYKSNPLNIFRLIWHFAVNCASTESCIIYCFHWTFFMHLCWSHCATAEFEQHSSLHILGSTSS